MARLHPGALLDRPPGPRYCDVLRFAEVAPQPPLPRPGTLDRWRAGTPEDFAFALVAPLSAVTSPRGPMRFDADLESAVGWMLDAATALRALAIVVPTGAQLTTGQRDRDLLAAYFDRIRRDSHQIVWAPTGLWEPETARALAERLGVHCAFDPFETKAPAGAFAYARLRAMGGRLRFSDDMLLGIAADALAHEATDVYVAIESPRSFREASRLHQLATDAASDG